MQKSLYIAMFALAASQTFIGQASALTTGTTQANCGWVSANVETAISNFVKGLKKQPATCGSPSCTTYGSKAPFTTQCSVYANGTFTSIQINSVPSRYCGENTLPTYVYTICEREVPTKVKVSTTFDPDAANQESSNPISTIVTAPTTPISNTVVIAPPITLPPSSPVSNTVVVAPTVHNSYPTQNPVAVAPVYNSYPTQNTVVLAPVHSSYPTF